MTVPPDSISNNRLSPVSPRESLLDRGPVVPVMLTQLKLIFGIEKPQMPVPSHSHRLPSLLSVQEQRFATSDPGENAVPSWQRWELTISACARISVCARQFFSETI
jgi:hypothetical protein